jgi:hypothetical protein
MEQESSFINELAVIFDSTQMAFSKYKTVTLLLSLIVLGCSSQEQIETKPFPIKNNAEHVFNLNANVIKDTIVRAFKIENDPEDNKHLRDIFWYYAGEVKEHPMAILFSAETSRDTIFSLHYFSKPNTADDVFLEVYHEAWISKYYHSHGHPLKFTTDFAIQLSSIDANKTKVKIIALNPEVINGTGFGVHGPANIYTPAQPTTIEEYSLLLFIADKVGDTTLPPLKLPAK